MKQLLRYMIGLIGALGVWVMMFGFQTNQFSFTSQTYAAVGDNKCDGAGDADCDTLCKDSKGDGCLSFLQGQRTNTLTNLANTLDQFLTFLYLIMWPLLYVAGLAMDNTLIYGEAFGLTGLLYQFWTIMRTIANFVIVFILVWTIGEQMRKGSKGAKELGKTILAIMVTGVVINISWFAIGAMVDVSTIATYGVGTLPLTLQSGPANDCSKKIGSIDDIKKLGTCRPIIATHSTLNFADTLSADQAKWKAYYSYTPTNGDPKQYFLSCVFKFDKVSRTERNTFVSTFTGAQARENLMWEKQNQDGSISSGVVIRMPKDAKINSNYCVLNNNDLFKMQGAGDNIGLGTKAFEDQLVNGIDQLRARGGQNIRKMVKGQEGMMGVMYTMYGNMLGFVNIKSTANGFSAEGSIMQFMIKGFFGLAIMFPLIALCIVLVMRLAYLWIIIGFSPLLVIGWTLEKMGIKNDYIKSMMEGIGKDITLGNVISLLLQPVIVVFVMSLGMMFLEALQTSTIDGRGFGDALQCNQAEGCCSVVDTFNICFEKINVTSGVDTFFHYLTSSIVNIIGIMLLYFMVFAVIKSNSITKKVGQQIQDFGTNYMGSMPIIPWRDAKGRFGGESVGVMGAKKGLSDSRDTITKPTEDRTADTVVKPPIEKFFETITGKSSDTGAKVSKALASKDMSDKNLETIAGRKDIGGELIRAIGDAKKDVKYTSANEFVNASDPNIAKLFKQYDVKNLNELFAHPRFIAETGSKSSDLMESLKVDKGWSKANDTIESTYKKNLQSINDRVNLLSSDQSIKKLADSENKGYATYGKSAINPGKKYLFNIKKDGDKIIGLETVGSIDVKTYDVKNYDELSTIANKLTKKELESFASIKADDVTKTDTSPGWKFEEKEGSTTIIKDPIK